MDTTTDSRVKDIISSYSYEGSTPQITKEAYNKWALKYDEDMLALNYKGHVLVTEFLKEYYTSEERRTVKILDVGAGSGLAGRELKNAGFLHVDGLDPSKDMLNVAKRDQLYENYFFEYIDDKKLDIPDNTYDALTGAGIFGEGGHVPVVALFEMVRLVKPGGYIVLATRVSVVENTETNKDLEPTMDKLEKDGRWRKLKRDTQTKLYSDRQAIVFVYKVL